MKLSHLKALLFIGIAVLLILPTTLMVTSQSSAATGSPFIGSWFGIDADGSNIRMVIAGNPQGPFQITSTDSYISFCGGAAGIVKGTGSVNQGNPNYLVARLMVVCFTTEARWELETSFTYNPTTDTLAGFSVTWNRANDQGLGCMTPPIGIIGWWPGDGNTNEIVSNRNGILRGDATYAPGLVDQAFSLDGDGDYIEVANDQPLNIGQGDFTIDLWVNFNDLNGEQVLMEKWIQGETVSQGWTLTKLSHQVLRLALDNGTDGEIDVDSGVLDLQPNTWYLFAATRRGESVTLYMNGDVIATAVNQYNLESDSSLKFGHRGEGGFYLNGLIDEVEFYNGAALAQEKIYELFSAGAYGKCKDFFYYPGIRAHPVWHNVDAWWWPEDKMLTLTVDDPNTPRNPDIKIKKSGAEKENGTVWFDLGGYDLKPGDIVTISDGVFSKTLVITTLTITNVDISSSIVYGTADPGTELRLPLPNMVITTNAKSDGHWEANLGAVGYFVQPGETIIAEHFDEDGDLTSFEYIVP